MHSGISVECVWEVIQVKMLIVGSTVEVYAAIMNTGDSQSWKMLVFLLILIQLILSVKSSVMVFGRAELKLMSEFFFHHV